MDQIFLGVMELQEAKNHQLKLQTQGVELILKVNPSTCTTGCKVTVEVWADPTDDEAVKSHFKNDYFKHVRGHEPNLEHLSQIFDPTSSEVICQACGAKFAPTVNECPDCGLVY
jgi:uncharacterized OB-fold protein